MWTSCGEMRTIGPERLLIRSTIDVYDPSLTVDVVHPLNLEYVLPCQPAVIIELIPASRCG